MTVDFDTLQDQAVTVRDRDAMTQERVGLDAVTGIWPRDCWGDSGCVRFSCPPSVKLSSPWAPNVKITYTRA